MEFLLIIALIISNLLWMLFTYKIYTQMYKERFTLLERIMRPNYFPSEPVGTTPVDLAPDVEALEAVKDYETIGQFDEFS